MNSVLTYPYFFPNETWLKMAALCWDRVFTFREITRRPPPAIKEIDELLGGILGTIDIRSVSRDPVVMKSFESWLEVNHRRLTAAEALIRSKFILWDLFPDISDYEK